MTLDVFIEGYDVSFECSYTGFGYFRCEILRGWNQELGRLQEQKYGFLWNRKGNFNLGLLGLLQFTGQFGGGDNGEERIQLLFYRLMRSEIGEPFSHVEVDNKAQQEVEKEQLDFLCREESKHGHVDHKQSYHQLVVYVVLGLYGPRHT